MTADNYPPDSRVPDGDRAACRVFLRELDVHAETWSSTHVYPEHAQACGQCADRLRRLDPFIELMRTRPAMPAKLKDRGFLDEVFEDIVQAAESKRLAEHLREAMAAVPAPPDCPWPLQASDLGGLDQEVAAPASVPAAAEEALWQRTLAEVREIVAEGPASVESSGAPYLRRRMTARRVVRLAVVAAGIALVAVGAWNFRQSDGTHDETRIVFVDVGELPNTLTVQLPNGLSLR